MTFSRKQNQTTELIEAGAVPWFSFRSHSWQLIGYDTIILLFVVGIFFVIAPSSPVKYPWNEIFSHFVLLWSCLFFFRSGLGIYSHIWRYSNVALYLRLVLADILAGILYGILIHFLPVVKIIFLRLVCIFSINLLLNLLIRLVYQYLWDNGTKTSWKAIWGRRILQRTLGIAIEPEKGKGQRINVAIVGAGRIGVFLAEEFRKNKRSDYMPCCFVDVDNEKIGRRINGIPVFAPKEITTELVERLPIQEFIIAITDVSQERKKELYMH